MLALLQTLSAWRRPSWETTSPCSVEKQCRAAFRPVWTLCSNGGVLYSFPKWIYLRLDSVINLVSLGLLPKGRLHLRSTQSNTSSACRICNSRSMNPKARCEVYNHAGQGLSIPLPDTSCKSINNPQRELCQRLAVKQMSTNCHTQLPKLRQPHRLSSVSGQQCEIQHNQTVLSCVCN